MQTTRPFKCPGCGNECWTLRALFLCCPRTLRAYTDQLIARGKPADRDDEKDHLPFARVLSNQISHVLRQEVAAHIAEQEARHDTAAD